LTTAVLLAGRKEAANKKYETGSGVQTKNQLKILDIMVKDK
jgi:hypothetical protein